MHPSSMAAQCPGQPSRDGKTVLATFARVQRRHRTWRCGQGLPAGNGPGAGPRLFVVSDAGEPLPQLDDSRQLALLVEGCTDRGGVCFGHDEHRRSMEHACRGRQARRW